MVRGSEITEDSSTVLDKQWMDSTLNHHISSSPQWFEMKRGLLYKAVRVDTPDENMIPFP